MDLSTSSYVSSESVSSSSIKWIAIDVEVEVESFDRNLDVIVAMYHFIDEGRRKT